MTTLPPPLDIAPQQLHRWHRHLVGADFLNGRTVRQGAVAYPVRMWNRVASQSAISGSPPERIEPEPLEACDAFRRHVDVAQTSGGSVRVAPGALAASELYARVLRIHPYEDGNGRVAFVALQAALRSQGLYVITFDDIERHDERLGHALRNDVAADYEPFARLIVERTRAAARSTLET